MIYGKTKGTDFEKLCDSAAKAEAQGVIHKMEHPDTKETWIVLDDKAALPFI